MLLVRLPGGTSDRIGIYAAIGTLRALLLFPLQVRGHFLILPRYVEKLFPNAWGGCGPRKASHLFGTDSLVFDARVHLSPTPISL